MFNIDRPLGTGDDLPMQPLLTATDLHKRFGNTLALRGVSLRLMPGEAHGFCAVCARPRHKAGASAAWNSRTKAKIRAIGAGIRLTRPV
ncbi:MAG: hypothetical protein EBX37_04155 [Alphaproteobacteria bacterium]|nr:hypothetical protein [Alphaproteobacteria bacterium]